MLGLAGYGSGIASHVAGGGLLPSAGVLFVMAVASVAAASILTRKELRTSRIVVAVVVAQGAWHAVLSGLAGHVGEDRSPILAPAVDVAIAPAAGARGSRTGSMYDAYEAMLPATSSTPGTLDTFLAHQVAHLAEQGVAMVLAHLLGAVGLGLFLARGEAALWGVLQLAVISWEESWRASLRAGAAVALSPLIGAPGLPGALAHVPVILRHGSWVRSGLRRRGPPALLAA